MSISSQIEDLKKALEAGNMNVAPSARTQGAALQMENLQDTMNLATFEDSALKLQKLFTVKPAKSTLVSFNRQLDYGVFGGSAVLEGAIGQEETSSYVQAVTPMAYYAHVRRTTLQSQLVATFDGVGAEDRADADAAIKMAGDIEFHLFRGHSAFSNAGVFDGNPLAMSQKEAGIHGLDVQIRQSDFMDSAKDLMFDEYGADQLVTINQNGTLQQSTIEDIYARAQMNHGHPTKLMIDPLTHGNYNKISHNKERIVLAGSPQQATGASLSEQWVAGGAISIESSRFLSGKTNPARPRLGTPGAPSAVASAAASSTSFVAGEVYKYVVTASNEVGEGAKSAVVTVTIGTSGDAVTLAITPASGIVATHYNVYRSEAGGTKLKFIGRTASTTFVDLNNRIPGFVTGFALDMRGMELAELMPFKSLELARVDLTTPKAYARFVTLMVKLPRFNILVDNLK